MHFRKIIHISGILIPVLARDDILGKSQTMVLILLGFGVYIALEALKPKISRDVLSLVYRESELEGLSIEPLSYIISVLSLIALSFFIDERLCFAAIAILTAGDGLAGIAGRRYGRHKFSFNENKSWEGSASGFITASLAGYYFAGPVALAGSFFGMAAGAASKQDNISVPYAALVAMVLVKWVAGVI